MCPRGGALIIGRAFVRVGLFRDHWMYSEYKFLFLSSNLPSVCLLCVCLSFVCYPVHIHTREVKPFNSSVCLSVCLFVCNPVHIHVGSSDCFRLSVCLWLENSTVGISEWLNNFYTWQSTSRQSLLACVWAWRAQLACLRAHKALKWMPFSAVSSASYPGFCSVYMQVLALHVRDVRVWDLCTSLVCIFVCLCVLLVCLFICLFVCMSLYTSSLFYLCVCVYWFVCLLACLCIPLVCLFVCLCIFTGLFVCLFVCLTRCPWRWAR